MYLPHSGPGRGNVLMSSGEKRSVHAANVGHARARVLTRRTTRLESQLSLEDQNICTKGLVVAVNELKAA